MNKVVFEYQGTRYESLNEIAEIRGVKKVNRRDFDRLEITEIEVLEPAPDQLAEAVPELPNKPEEPSTVTAELPKDTAVKGDKKDAEPIVNTNNKKALDKINEEKDKAEKAAQEKAETLQKKYGYADVDVMGAELKKMDGAAVINLAKEIGVPWKEDKHEGINRMRAGMAIRAVMFPGERRSRAPKSGWKSIALDELVKLAKNNKLKYRETIDEKITRMWVIKALNDASIAPPSKIN